MEKITKKLVILFPLIIVVIALIFIIVKWLSGEDKYYVGVVETKVVGVSSIIPGRVDSVFVEEGDFVKKGQVLGRLKPDIINTKVGQAEGVLEAAHSVLEMAKKGARAQEKEAAKNQYLMAKSQFEFAKKTWERFKHLYADSIISKQELDEMQFKYNAARDQMNAAKAVYDMVLEGARKEQISAAQAQFKSAENVYKEAKAFQNETYLISPMDGEVSSQIAQIGEVVPPGYAVFTVQSLDDMYALIQVREDLMKDIKMNAKFKGTIPALGNETYDFKVSFISPMAEFADWVPTNDKSQFDLRTFEVHLKPDGKIENLRPGMTVKIFQ